MAPAFPSLGRVPRVVAAGAVAVVLAATALGTATALRTLGAVGRPFPGFVMWPNAVIAPVNLAHWPSPSGIYLREVTHVNGVAIGSAEDVHAIVEGLPSGTPVAYTVRSGATVREVVVPTQRMGMRDWLLGCGLALLNGFVFLGAGLCLWVLRPREPVARPLLYLCACIAVLTLTGIDSPEPVLRVLIVALAFLPAASINVTLTFPSLHPLARHGRLAYVAAAVLAVALQGTLWRPQLFARLVVVPLALAGVSQVSFLGRLAREFLAPRSPLGRERARVMTLTTLALIGLPSLTYTIAAVGGMGIGLNAGLFTASLFPITIAWAVVQHDLFEIDAVVKRGTYYLVFTGLVAAAYVAGAVVFNVALRAETVRDSAALPVVFAIAVLLLLNPLRTRLQTFVDRVFFGAHYDGARALALAGSSLAEALERRQIDRIVRASLDTTIPNTCTRLFATQGGGREPVEIGSGCVLPAVLTGPLAEGRLLTTFDSLECYPDPATHDRVRRALRQLDLELAVPIQLRGTLVGVLAVGAKRSGLYYTPADVEFLRALAHAAAIALQNAHGYEQLASLNRDLEGRVRERTRALQQAEGQLVQSEKMASLGRLVAGVAHEINNPVSFIASSVAPLRRRLARAREGATPETARLLAEADEIVGIMARGAERTAAVVRDLRSFSRLQETALKPVDLHGGLEVTLRLLEARWHDRIAVHREYGTLPLVECDAGQINQVFMNLLANACDAVESGGNIWVTTRADAGHVTVAVRDDGHGIPADALGRIFEPFFTTKPIGQGTGLGLAISHGVVAAHGGRIEVDSEPGHGSTFRVVLPITAAGTEPQAVAS